MQPAADLVIAERFRLVRLLGQGGMGSVWLAQHLGLDIPCAVKFIEGEYAQMGEAQARFGREAKAAAALRSPHVVQILDHGIWQGTPYMAMELLEGEDLGKRLAKVGRMDPRTLCTVMTQVARALTKAHAAGIVHRDLKPENIYLVKDDEREIAKVLDFGIAKLNSTALEGSATKTGAMLGTPYYMSPEQAQGIKGVDHRSDLWSVAVIVFQALTGRLPFESEALGDLLVKIIVAPIPVPSQIAPGLPLQFDRWWAKAADRDPNNRYQSAKELSDGLSLVFGQSQLTDVIDRSELRAAMAGNAGPNAPVQANTPGYGMMGTPSPVSRAASTVGTPQPYATPQPYQGQGTPHPFQGTPQPYQGQGTPQPYGQGTPQPFGGTPQPYAYQGTPQPGASPAGPYAQGPHGNTGAPIARTFGDTPPPQKRTGLIVGLGAGAVLLVALIGIGVSMKGKAPAAGGAALTASVPVATATATATQSAMPAVSLEPPPAPSDSSVPPADSSVVAAGSATPGHGGGGGGGGSGHGGGGGTGGGGGGGGASPGKPPPAKPPPTKKPDLDLGI